MKLAALYWGKLARIVPGGYPTRDSDVVRELDFELDLIVNQEPGTASYSVGRDFAQVITTNSEELRERYRVQTSQMIWGVSAPIDPLEPQPQDDVAWIHLTKLDPNLRDALINRGLAVDARGQDWIGVHPTVAEVYMTALADEMAARRGYQPVTIDALHHVAASWSVARIAAALLGEELREPEPSSSQPEVALAFFAIQTLIPKDLDAVPASRIAEVRKKYGAELATFQDAIAAVADRAALREIRDANALREHLQLTYDARVKPQLETLRRDLKLLKLDTVVSAVDMKVAAPGLIVGSMGAAGTDASEPIMVGSGVAFGVTSLMLNQRREGMQRYQASPAAYLLRCEEGLTPASLSERVQRGVRRFVRGV